METQLFAFVRWQICHISIIWYQIVSGDKSNPGYVTVYNLGVALKAYPRGQTISFCAHKRKVNTERLLKLTHKILESDALHNHSLSPNTTKKKMEVQMEFDLLSTQQAEYLDLQIETQTSWTWRESWSSARSSAAPKKLLIKVSLQLILIMMKYVQTMEKLMTVLKNVIIHCTPQIYPVAFLPQLTSYTLWTSQL